MDFLIVGVLYILLYIAYIVVVISEILFALFSILLSLFLTIYFIKKIKEVRDGQTKTKKASEPRESGQED